MRIREKGRRPHTQEEIVRTYFECVENKDLDNLLSLFDYDAVIHEPFSNVKGGLSGLSAIEPFLKVAMMANSKMHRTIKIEKPTKAGRLVSIVTFEKGEKVKGRFTFDLKDQPDGEKKIKMLRIEFI